ncbi:MAG: cation-binding protein, partial [Pseudonocardiales bacterium]|nr:cation-binding protein [Pseudonocardiales bacterium]
QESLQPAQLRRVGLRWEVVRRTAPTRPHAVVSRRPPGNVLAALPLTIVDRARDNADRTARAGGPPSRPARRVSGALARLAGRIEHAPGMRRGETATTRTDRST